MSQATKKKHVAKEVLDNFVLPAESEEIVRILAGRGNNLHEVETASGTKFLVSMPTKFRKSVWIKRGDYVIVTPIEEGDKVKAEITHILLKDQIKYIQNEGKWPQAFQEETKEKKDNLSDELFENPNRAAQIDSSEESDESDESEDENE